MKRLCEALLARTGRSHKENGHVKRRNSGELLQNSPYRGTSSNDPCTGAEGVTAANEYAFHKKGGGPVRIWYGCNSDFKEALAARDELAAQQRFGLIGHERSIERTSLAANRTRLQFVEQHFVATPTDMIDQTETPAKCLIGVSNRVIGANDELRLV